jgi:single-strand DNA-binding protein
MSGLNKVMVIGNLGGDPELRFTASGSPITTFSVACSRIFTNGEGKKQEETEWFTVVVWNKLAEICNQFLLKGQKVYAEGRLHNRSWEGTDGQKHTRTEIIASHVIFLSLKSGNGPKGFAEGPDDVPF